MTTLDKLNIFDSLPSESAKIERIGKESIKITLPCGCTNVQHSYCGNPKKHADALKMSILEADRAFFVQLCDTHKYNTPTNL